MILYLYEWLTNLSVNVSRQAFLAKVYKFKNTFWVIFNPIWHGVGNIQLITTYSSFDNYLNNFESTLFHTTSEKMNLNFNQFQGPFFILFC